MRKLIILITVALMMTFQVQAGDAKAKAKAIELMEVMELTKMMDESFKHMGSFSDRMIDSQKMSPTQKIKAKAMAKKSMEATIKSMKDINWNEVLADIYSEVFTEEEINGLLEFYKSPVGKKFLKKQPELMQATMGRMQTEMGKIMPKIQQDIQNAIKDTMSAPEK